METVLDLALRLRFLGSTFLGCTLVFCFAVIRILGFGFALEDLVELETLAMVRGFSLACGFPPIFFLNYDKSTNRKQNGYVQLHCN